MGVILENRDTSQSSSFTCRLRRDGQYGQVNHEPVGGSIRSRNKIGQEVIV